MRQKMRQETDHQLMIRWLKEILKQIINFFGRIQITIIGYWSVCVWIASWIHLNSNSRYWLVFTVVNIWNTPRFILCFGSFKYEPTSIKPITWTVSKVPNDFCWWTCVRDNSFFELLFHGHHWWTTETFLSLDPSFSPNSNQLEIFFKNWSDFRPPELVFAPINLQKVPHFFSFDYLDVGLVYFYSHGAHEVAVLGWMIDSELEI